MKLLRCLFPLFLAACSADPFKGQLTTENNQNEPVTNYPPGTLQEQTFVLNQPVRYESKRPATQDEMRTATKRAGKLGEAIGNARLVAIPVSSARGNTTVADVMVYDTRRHALATETVYRIGYTPPSGQSLQLELE